MIPSLVTFVRNNNMRLSTNGIVTGTLATVIGLIVAFSHGFKIVHIARVKNTRVLVADVHPDFAAAIEQQHDHEE
jgi:hypothetical protein